MTIAGEIIGMITEFLTGVFGALASGMSELTSIFYVAETGFTLFGVIALLGISFGLIMLVIKWVRSLL